MNQPRPQGQFTGHDLGNLYSIYLGRIVCTERYMYEDSLTKNPAEILKKNSRIPHTTYLHILTGQDPIAFCDHFPVGLLQDSHMFPVGSLGCSLIWDFED